MLFWPDCLRGHWRSWRATVHFYALAGLHMSHSKQAGVICYRRAGSGQPPPAPRGSRGNGQGGRALV